ncbi:hypothetical protein PAXRUDRAFT_826125 [Paxillus rubicundulus Ve08.2h10]|uniref:Uncharacterized protein n=1 Tax=Paxillus rubicundulus Ve08.2h10 TaxID=930991 RepID=A0A0D0EA23_9AGAM|nr:hypothetical protein PAXRUDRAFT_826125 [Paxillus rubicundulus Ve08.2h10]
MSSSITRLSSDTPRFRGWKTVTILRNFAIAVILEVSAVVPLVSGVRSCMYNCGYAAFAGTF